MAPSLVGAGVSWGSYFFMYENAKARYQGWQAEPLGSAHHLLSASEAGVFTVLLTNPIWVIKTRLQLQRAETSALGQSGERAAASKHTNPLPASAGLNGTRSMAVTPAPLTTHYKGMVDAFFKVLQQEGFAVRCASSVDCSRI